MVNFISNYVLTAYIQVVIFFVLVGLFFLQRRRLELVSSGLSWLKTIFLFVLFLYFVWNWASEIPASMRLASVLGMLFINLHMVYNLMLGNLEEKYRRSLEEYGQDIKNKARLAEVWRTGKKFIHTRYFFDALISGYSPGNFLKAVVTRQIPADIQRVLAKHGFDQELVTFQTMRNFLTTRLDQSHETPPELKDILTPAIRQFGEHPWIQDQVNEFLRLALQDPEKLYHSAWSETPSEKS